MEDGTKLIRDVLDFVAPQENLPDSVIAFLKEAMEVIEWEKLQATYIVATLNEDLREPSKTLLAISENPASEAVTLDSIFAAKSSHEICYMLAQKAIQRLDAFSPSDDLTTYAELKESIFTFQHLLDELTPLAAISKLEELCNGIEKTSKNYNQEALYILGFWK